MKTGYQVAQIKRRVRADERSKVSDKQRTADWNEYCKRWTEVDTGLTYAEAVCRTVDPDRTPIEAMMIEKILKGETE